MFVPLTTYRIRKAFHLMISADFFPSIPLICLSVFPSPLRKNLVSTGGAETERWCPSHGLVNPQIQLRLCGGRGMRGKMGDQGEKMEQGDKVEGVEKSKKCDRGRKVIEEKMRKRAGKGIRWKNGGKKKKKGDRGG